MRFLRKLETLGLEWRLGLCYNKHFQRKNRPECRTRMQDQNECIASQSYDFEGADIRADFPASQGHLFNPGKNVTFYMIDSIYTGCQLVVLLSYDSQIIIQLSLSISKGMT